MSVNGKYDVIKGPVLPPVWRLVDQMCSDKIFGKIFVSEKTIADFIKLKTFLVGNILGVKLMILDLKKTKIKKIFVSSPLNSSLIFMQEHSTGWPTCMKQ